MFCRNCGKQISDTAKFCPGCGKEVVRANQNAQAKQPAKIQPEVRAQQAAQPKIKEEKQAAQTQTPRQAVPPQATQQAAQTQTPQQAVPPQVPTEEAQSKPKKKKGGVIWVTILLLIVLIAIGVGAFFLFRDKIPFDKLGISGKPKTEETTEKETEKEAGKEDEEIVAEGEFADLMEEIEAGKFEEAISEILDMDEEEISKDEEALKNIMQKAVEGQVEAIKHDIQEQISEKKYAEALELLDEKADYLAKLAEERFAKEFVTDDILSDMREEILSAYQDAVFAEAESKGNQGSTSDVQDIFRESDKYLSGEAYENGKTRVYTKLVLAKLGSMQVNQEDAVIAMQYINANLNLVQNDCWVLEFWDYFKALDELKRGVSSDGEVTHMQGGYLLPDSGIRELSEDDLYDFSAMECRLARYEIYARHGRGFSDPSVTNFFAKQSWYEEKIAYQDFDEFSLSEVERKNRDLIVKYEQKQGYR